MYSSATMSNSASGLSGADGLGEGDDLGAGEGEEEEEGGEADDLDFREGDEGGWEAGVGAAFPNGFTGPVGLRGAGGGALGVGEGEGAPDALESARQTASAKIKERCLMKLR
jgi:hypothetical protein